MPEIKTYNAGDEVDPLDVGEINRPQITEYSRVSKDPNPMHTDEEMAKAAGHPTVFAQGMLGMGLLSRAITTRFGIDNLRQCKVQFRTMTWPGENITCHMKVTEVEEKDGERLLHLEVKTQNEHGIPKVIGTAIAAN